VHQDQWLVTLKSCIDFLEAVRRKKVALAQEEEFPPKKVLLILSMKEGRYSNEAGHVSL